MRYIPLKDKRPDQAWIEKANGLLEELKVAPDRNARNAIIDKNSAVWGELKAWLLTLSDGKCWFSEAKDVFSHWDVEHYRPKKSAKDMDGTTHEGYWWLAFDWKNLRILGNVGNRKKGTYFPLKQGCCRIEAYGDERQESPIMLDPTDPDDPNLLSFDVEGNAIPDPNIISAEERERVEYSVDRYNLNFPPLVDKRKVVWNECWSRITEYRKEAEIFTKSNGQNMIARTQSKEKMKQIRDMLKSDKELSTVAKACILSTHDPILTKVLATC